MKLSFEELKGKILMSDAKSEYKQASIIMLRKIYNEHIDSVMPDGDGLQIKERKEVKIEPTFYYVQNKRNGYVGNSMIWWMEGDAGYSSKLEKAKKFALEEAKKICGDNDDFIMWRCQYIDDIAELTVDMQNCDLFANAGL